MTPQVGPDVRVRSAVSGESLTTFAVGGIIQTLFEPINVSGAAEAVRAVQRQCGRLRILGAGSNVIVPDEGINDPVITFGREFNRFSLLRGPLELETCFDLSPEPPLDELGERVRVVALAGTPLMALSRKLCAMGLSGLEFAAGIPASVGGALRMNAGAHGAAVGEITRSVAFLDGEGVLQLQRHGSIGFRYRECGLPADAVILAVEFELTRGSEATISADRNRCLEHRRVTQPLHLPSAGSVFRNPSQKTVAGATLDQQRSAGWLLEQVGLKGVREGGVEFSPLHANWLVKVAEGASAADVRTLVELGQRRVHEAFDVELKPEIVFW